jgi:hypothetical protein
MKKILFLALFLLASLPGFAQHSTTLHWTNPSSCALCVVRIYRFTTTGGVCPASPNYQLLTLTALPAGTTTYVDSTVVPGSTYCYVATEVNPVTSLESVFSNQVIAIFSIPQSPQTLTGIRA